LSNNTVFKLKNIALQVFFLGSCFYILTGAAFVAPWEYHLFFEARSTLHQLLIRFIILMGMLVAWRSYLIRGDMFFELEPVRSIKVFFKISPFFSVSILFLIYFTLQFANQVLMHAGLGTALWDLGLYDQVIWNTAHGNFLISSIRGGLHIFSERFKPMLVLLSPIYFQNNNTVLLFFITTLITSSSIVAVYLIAKSLTNSKETALVFSICAFFYLPLRNGINFLFHTQVLADPLLLFGFYCVIKKKGIFAYLLFLLALTCKESVAMDVLGIGLFLIARREKTGWGISILALFWIALFILFIEPNFCYAYQVQDKWSFYSHFSSLNLESWAKLLKPNPILFLFFVFGPVLFLPYACRKWTLLLGPSLALRLLSIYPGFRLITAHYTAGLNALIFIGAIYGFIEALDLRKKIWRNINFFRSALLGAAILFTGVPQLFSIERFLWEASYSENQKAVKILESIPSDHSVLSTETASAHLSHRAHLFVFFNMFAHAPYEKMAEKPDLIVVDKLKLQPREQKALGEFRTKGYELIFESTLIQIYERPSESQLISSDLIDEWNRINRANQISYRKIVRKWYKYLLIFAASFCIFRLFKKEKLLIHS